MLKISIPTPCHEDWNKMTPDETGRYCGSCAKSVVDFTNMSDHEVQNYFLNKKEANTCGRFKKSQLQRIVIKLPENILSIDMPLWKKFLAACLIVFSTALFSCDTNVKDKIITKAEINMKINQPDDRGYVGGLMFTHDSVPSPVELCSISSGEAIIIDTISDMNGLAAILMPVNTSLQKTDTIPATAKPEENIMIGDTIYEELPVKKLKTIIPDSATKTKNPHKADSIDCKTIKSYY